jgi:glyoxylase I family protein
MIVSIHHVTVLVGDTRRALDFYQGILGLAVDESRPQMDVPGAWLWAGAQQIHLIERSSRAPLETPRAHGGRDFHVALAVTGLDALSAALSAHGVAYTPSRSGRRALFCRDPDGNAIELVEVQPASLTGRHGMVIDR